MEEETVAAPAPLHPPLFAGALPRGRGEKDEDSVDKDERQDTAEAKAEDAESHSTKPNSPLAPLRDHLP